MGIVHNQSMPTPINIAYQRWHRVAPWFNWIKPRDGSTWWQEFDRDEFAAVSSMKLTLGNDPILHYKQVGQIRPGDRWLYEMNWFYQDDLLPNSPILDSFISNPVMVNGLHNGDGYLVLNLSSEAWCQSTRIMHMQGFISNKGLPLDRVIYMTGALNAADIFRKQGYSMRPLSVNEFEMHASNKVAEGQTWTGTRDMISHRFLCFNRLHRPHRIALLAGLHGRGLLDHFHYSFADRSNGMGLLEYASRYMGHQTPNHQHLMSGLRDINLPMVLDTNNWGPNLAHSHLLNDVLPFYQTSGISVVTETTGYDEEVFLSEKTFHPIRYCQPFIMVSAPGTLSHLQGLGYRTFSDWWDEEYDRISDHHSRIEAVIDQIQLIAKWPADRFERFLHDSRETCIHNLNVLKEASNNRSYTDQLLDLFG